MNVFSHDYVENLYQQYLENPESLSADWRQYFESFDHSAGTLGSAATIAAESLVNLQDKVDQLIRGFRVRGHLEASIDPLGIPRPGNQELIPEAYGLTAGDMDKVFSTRTIHGEDFRTLRDIVEHLRQTYCRSIGAQFMHIDDHDLRTWLQRQMEKTKNRISLSRETQLRILTRLTDATILEEFMRRKFMGAKTFSLEGSETLIPLLDLALEKAGQHGIVEVVMGMAHRGRLNVLANIMGKRAENIFWSFDEPRPEDSRGGGDVLYHMGYSTDWTTSQQHKVHISLCFNPSHLEFVNAVALGRCRAKQDRIRDARHEQVMSILVHGDAAFAGEGIVQETLNLSQLNAYRTGGTLHVILNNQVGFTTIADDGRSTTYASDVAKMLQIPIFHVNGEDPEAVAQVVELAMEFRHKFRRDVVIDMYCYRRLGHNESDEPRFTQPLMYQTIDSRPTIRESYLQHLAGMGGVTVEEGNEIARLRQDALQREFESAKADRYQADTQTMGGYWSGYYGGPERSDDDVDTGVPIGKLTYTLGKLAETPPGFTIHPKLVRIFEQRREMANGSRPLDWSTAELAAFATLSVDGHPVRLTGQDCQRGTFSQRHSVLHDYENGKTFSPVRHIADGQADVSIFNSPLSETGVLGFEYGYSLDRPESLVLWEAQFGDFFNVAQVIVDQFISSAEDKWRRLSGLVMLLPHGFEGAGPEHCSARLERFLTQAAEHNIQVAVPTTSAQYFHLLRRQVKRPWRKPLIVLTPKSLLREPFVSCEIEQFTSGRFQRVLADPEVLTINNPSKIILCTGKIGVELLKLRAERQVDDVAIIRMEQLYPIPHRELQAALSSYADGTPVVWTQEEPKNMGAWYFIKVNFSGSFYGRWPLTNVISRAESASPATGSKKAHQIEQKEICDAALQAQDAPARV
jgi:2-oxoglutarate dehydrogenase E1 component